MNLELVCLWKYFRLGPLNFARSAGRSEPCLLILRRCAKDICGKPQVLRKEYAAEKPLRRPPLHKKMCRAYNPQVRPQSTIESSNPTTATNKHKFRATTHAPQPKVVDNRGHEEGAKYGAWASEEKQQHGPELGHGSGKPWGFKRGRPKGDILSKHQDSE